jgi:hypothetical protein
MAPSTSGKGKDKKGKKELKALYLGLDSINDLARNLAGEKSYLLAVKRGAAYRLMCSGERVGEGRIIYYFDSKKIGRYLIYGAEEESGERVEMADDVANRTDHYKSQRIPIIEIGRDPYPPMAKGDLKGVRKLEAKDPGALARALINSADEDEQPKLCAFADGRDRIIGTLALLEGHDRIFVYAKAGSGERFSNMIYDYNSDTVEYANSVGGTSKINIRTINLAEPPLFFKA